MPVLMRERVEATKCEGAKQTFAAACTDDCSADKAPFRWAYANLRYSVQMTNHLTSKSKFLDHSQDHRGSH